MQTGSPKVNRGEVEMAKIIEVKYCMQTPSMCSSKEFCPHCYHDFPSGKNRCNFTPRTRLTGTSKGKFPAWCPLPNKQEKGDDNGK
jgi:hypothetical protein